MKRNNLFAILTGWLALTLAPHQVMNAADGGTSAALSPPSTTVSGRVANGGTGAYLEGAVVQLSGTGRQVVTDRQGRYTIAVPRDVVTLAVSYTGLDTQHISLTLEDGRAAIRDVVLTSDIYRLETFVVEGEREGSAMAITRQRQAPNVKNVVATDAFGTMTDDNVGLFLERVPGINTVTNTGTVRSVMVRGIAANLNTVSMDGIQLANTNAAGTNREFDFLQASISMLESIEVTKAPTPDMPASSIGGNINMITRSIFARKNPRSFNYAIGATLSIGDLADLRPRATADRRWYSEPIKGLTPSVSFNFTDVYGKNKNIGLTLSYSSNIRFLNTITLVPFYPLVPVDEPARIDRTSIYVNPAGPSNRQNRTVKLEYKLSEQTLVSLTAAYTDFYMENDSRTHDFRTGAGSQFAPGSNESRSEALPANNTFAQITQSGWQQQHNNYRFAAAVVHNLDGLKIDYAATLSKSDAVVARSSDPAVRKGVDGKALGDLSTGVVRNIGWVAQRQPGEEWPFLVTQTAGPDVYDLANYPSLTATQNNNGAKTNIVHAHFNIRKDLRLAVPAYLKTGAQYQREERTRFANNFQYSFDPPGGATAPGALVQFLDTDSWIKNSVFGQRQAPWLDFRKVAESIDKHPEQWTENLLYKHTQRLQADVEFEESIGSIYAMGGVQLRNLAILAGVRVEETKTTGEGPQNQATLTPEENARRNAFVGPLTEAEAQRRAEYQLGQRAHGEGRYKNVFPGIHFKYAHKSGFVARASYSTSLGRPPLTFIIPNTTVNDAGQRLTISNTGLKAQLSDNFDVSLEYYFEPVGLFSIGVFSKDVENFIYTDTSGIVSPGADNGFEGNYVGYGITTRANGGFAKYRGLEVGYQQQFTFLPGFLSGLSLNLNYTQLETEGNYGGAIGTTQVAGFRPKTANIAVNYRRARYDFRVQTNWVDKFMTGVNANPAGITYESAHIKTSAKIAYALSGRTTVYLNWDNIFEDLSVNRYRGAEKRITNVATFPSTISAGIHGRF